MTGREPILTARYRQEKTKQAWAEEQLARACARIRASLDGTEARHTVLFKAACRLGPYVREGLLAWELVLERLTQAARSVGLDGSRSGEVYRTIRDGVHRGAEDDVAWYPPSVVGLEESRRLDREKLQRHDSKRSDPREQLRQVIAQAKQRRT